jgi:thymidylate synthase (FAD)
LKELKAVGANLSDFLVKVDPRVDQANEKALKALLDALNEGLSNDLAKYMLPEAFKTSLVWTINMRSLQNFFRLRLSKAALWEIRELAKAVYEALPIAHRFMYKEIVDELE